MRGDEKRARAGSADEQAIEWLAESIASGRPVDPADVDGLLPGAASGTSPIVANLIALSKLSELHRVGDPAGPAPGDAIGVGTWGTLRLLEKVGEGSFGEVFRAWDTQLHRVVALKLQRAETGEEVAARMLEEGRLLARVDHPGVVRVHGGATHEGRAGLWMEMLEGPTLEAALRTSGPLDPGETARVGAELCDALGAVHDAGLVHGDVKLQNVIGDAGGRVVLMDFGAGSRAWAGHDVGPRTGTPAYTPPEIFAGERPTPRSDLFSLGVLLFALLADRFPVQADSAEELAEAVRAGRHDRLRDVRGDVPPELAAVVEKAMEPDPARRFRSASEMGAALRRLAPAGATATGPAAPTVVAPTPQHRKRVVAWAIAVVAAAALVWLFRSPAPGPPVEEARLLRGSDPAEKLLSGDLVGVGDLLHLQLDVTRASWIYVLERDDRGSLSLLFPLPGYALQNPVPAGRDVEIPGAPAGGRSPMGWTMSGGGGTEHFLVVASLGPLREFEDELARLPLPGEGATARALEEPAARSLYRGVTGMATLPEGPEGVAGAGEALFDLARRLGSEGGGSPWVWEISLRNP